MTHRRTELIVALDTPSRERALDLTQQLLPHLRWFKVGLELFTACGPSIVGELSEIGAEIFLDLKFHDIPNTVARAVSEASRLKIGLLDLHLTGGDKMVRRAVEERNEACAARGLEKPRLLGITVLTSLMAQDLKRTGIQRSPAEQVLELASQGLEAGLDGVVASPQEIIFLRKQLGNNFLIVTPGIRPEGSASDDQARTMTPRQAAAAGADFLVVGRPITGAKIPADAACAILESLSPFD